MKNTSIYDASASALGYIYQVRFALLLALQKIGLVTDPDDCFISIEKLDDIAFEEKGDPIELLQAKYHGSPGNLSNRSSDLWKTIRVWSDMIADTTKPFEAATFTLLTTESTTAKSIASYLGVCKGERNVEEALKLMLEISCETGNKTNKKAYEAFSSLELWQQKKLLNSTYILSNSPTILEVEEKIRRNLRMSASDYHLDAFCTRLEGEWFKRAIEVMSSDQENAIGLSELISILDDLRSQFLPGNLPSDYDDVEPEDIDIDSDDRTFVEQLRLIGASNRIIRNAVINYYRAFEQRSRWSREGLVKPGEIKKYMGFLKDEWEQRSALMEMEYDFSRDKEKLVFGRKLHHICQIDGAKPIRPEFKSAYVARGTYHDLSDCKEIGWHPDYIEMLQPANDEGVAQ
ncbi:hypothetical protein A3759_15900 [Thalassolituus sp. HI0120]|nr:hypothetical protein A3759_15900 [Thalassolituus sp. HI0120]